MAVVKCETCKMLVDFEYTVQGNCIRCYQESKEIEDESERLEFELNKNSDK